MFGVDREADDLIGTNTLVTCPWQCLPSVWLGIYNVALSGLQKTGYAGRFRRSFPQSLNANVTIIRRLKLFFFSHAIPTLLFSAVFSMKLIRTRSVDEYSMKNAVLHDVLIEIRIWRLFMKSTVFRLLSSYSVEVHRRFVRTYRFHLQDRAIRFDRTNRRQWEDGQGGNSGPLKGILKDRLNGRKDKTLWLFQMTWVVEWRSGEERDWNKLNGRKEEAIGRITYERVVS
jgi:hypothetical protein